MLTATWQRIFAVIYHQELLYVTVDVVLMIMLVTFFGCCWILHRKIYYEYSTIRIGKSKYSSVLWEWFLIKMNFALFSASTLFLFAWTTGNSLSLPKLYIVWLIWRVIWCNNLTFIGKIYLFAHIHFAEPVSSFPSYVFFISQLSYRFTYRTENRDTRKLCMVIYGMACIASPTLTAFIADFRRHYLTLPKLTAVSVGAR